MKSPSFRYVRPDSIGAIFELLDTNNTAEVIDRNEFVADIYIKPAKSINYITLNFVATRSGIAFEEIGA